MGFIVSKLPFFKFDAASWLTGNITLLTLEEQAIFINLCALIWRDGGEYEMDPLLHRRLNITKDVLSTAIGVLCNANLLLCKDGVLSVKFLTEQLQSHADFTAKKAEAGRKGGNKRWQSIAKKKGDRREKKEESRKENEEPEDDEPDKQPLKPYFDIYADYLQRHLHVTLDRFRSASQLTAEFRRLANMGVTPERMAAACADDTKRVHEDHYRALDTPKKFVDDFLTIEQKIASNPANRLKADVERTLAEMRKEA